ncbi:hypothetical protein [Maritalea sp.]|jgi:hypothetical protein|uniref:hypothetical protein n=1 Tax=Maritalea sp. TaxID=2003361 RepID=UPI0039E498A8
MNFEIKTTPRSERQAIILKALDSANNTYRLDDFRGDPIDLKVIKLDIKLPVYRMENCRTYSEQQNTIAKKSLPPEFFGKGQESSSAQLEQHNILRRITKNAKASIANIDEVLTLEGQTDPILITSTGVVVNGNRRLSAMRELYGTQPNKHAGFAYVRCAVLPPESSADDIDDIEAALQARPQTKLDYDWIGEAQLVRRQLNKDRTFDQVAHQLRRKPAEIKNLLQALEEAELYLSDWTGKPGQYGLVSEDGEQLFKDIPKQIGTQQAMMQNASRAIAWSLFDNRDKLSGRVYGYNSAFGKLAPEVINTVSDELEIDLSSSNDEESEEFDFSIDDDELAVNYQPFVDILKSEETREDSVDVLIEACVTAIEREKGKKRKDAALKSLAQIHSKLAAIDISTAGISTYVPMIKQLGSIGDLVAKLQDEIDAAVDASKKPTEGVGINE